MSTELFIYIIVLCVFATLCLTWLLFCMVYVIGKYTDLGKEKRKEKEKKKKIHDSQDDLPIQGMDLNLISTPKIETSFGDERIGKVYKNADKT